MSRRTYAGLGAIACLMMSTSAFAADATRSSAALPTAQPAPAVPTQGIRSATPLKKKSALNRDATIGLGILGGVAVGAALVIATDDDDDADSPG